MSAALITDAAFTVPVPRNRLDVAAMLADPQIAQALHTAIDVFVHAIMIRRVVYTP